MTDLQYSLFGVGEPRVDTALAFDRIALDERSWIDVVRGFLVGADTLFDELAAEVDWKQGRRWMFDRMVDDPRLSRWYNRDDGVPHRSLDDVRRALQDHYGVPFGSVGLNFYRDGHDSVAFHRDRELRHLDNTLVAIVTLGSRRPFLVRPKLGGPSIDVAPASGDLLVMGGGCQADYEHGVPKSTLAGPRISASYRWSDRSTGAPPSSTQHHPAHR